MENIAHLYKITNTKTNEYYVGKHIGRTQENSRGKLYWGSGKRITRQIKKYGTEIFKYEILCISNEDYIYELESKYVTKELIQEDKLCLNITPGGFKPPSQKGVIISEATRQKLKNRIPWNKGKSLSEEQKNKLSQINLGKKHSEETKNKFKNRVPWNAGKKGLFKHTEERKKQISEWSKGNKFNLGRIFMNDGKKNFRIKKEEIEIYLEKGLVTGRLTLKTIKDN